MKYLEALKSAMTWLSKTSVIQRAFGLVYLQVRNNQRRLAKCQEFEKFQLPRGDDIF